MDRSAVMRSVRGTNTKPELLVRRLVTALGFRYRIHRRDIPGTPDLAFIGRGKVIFVHGCFWHGHDCPRGKRVPRTNTQYWVSKIGRNQERDRQTKQRLESQGWLVLEIWECETKDELTVKEKLRSFLSD
jgi:DNA mismatch endonuclease (patch repair protein)